MVSAQTGFAIEKNWQKRRRKESSGASRGYLFTVNIYGQC